MTFGDRFPDTPFVLLKLQGGEVEQIMVEKL